MTQINSLHITVRLYSVLHQKRNVDLKWADNKS